ncbi:MAG TPA: UMP kinase [Nitrososphaeraceae archaeon]|jgi:uridylate kinase|nr:UMP kinase [Nitrososphaeraceae archaeon]
MNNGNRIIRKRVAIKLSGSIFSEERNQDTIKKYAEMLTDISIDVQPIVIAGGGKIARHYINLARCLGSDEASLDIMGIEVSRLNAKLLIVALGEQAYSQVPKNLEEVTIAAESGKIVIVGGLHPGQSTNATSALIAEKVRATRFLNATDVDGIYDLDPNTSRNAKLLNEITVSECMEILKDGSSMAGTYDLMDIVALKVIERSKIPTRVLRSDITNIRDAVIGIHHMGTEIVIVKKQS